MRIKNSKIREICIKNFGEKPLKIIDSSKGYDQIVKIVQTTSRKLVFKCAKREPEILKNQIFASEKWSAAKIPVPSILYYEDGILVESFIEGIPFNELKASKKIKERIYLDLGRLMKKMHSVKTKG
jgi:hypothetical protein